MKHTGRRTTDGVFALERREEIARLVQDDGRVRAGDLAARFSVSAVTIRKDLLALESRQRLVRTHGGAVSVDTSPVEPVFAVRENLQHAGKARIGATAAALVHDGESIILDSGTTALSVARQLKTRNAWTRLTVVTNGLRIASELGGHPGVNIVLLGGRVRWEALSMIGSLGVGLFERVNVQKAFVGAAGFTVGSGLSEATDEEAEIKRSMVTAAREVIGIVDHTKWGHAAVATFCSTDDISVLVTDSAGPQSMMETLSDRGVSVEVAADEQDGDAP